MARNPSSPPPNADVLARKLAAAHTKFSDAMGGEGASQQVMSGFAEAYRAWLEALSAKPETMLDLQGRYMQEQMRLWMNSMQPHPAAEEEEAAEGERVAADDPLEVGRREVQGPLDGRQRDGDYGGVEHDHQLCRGDDNERGGEARGLPSLPCHRGR